MESQESGSRGGVRKGSGCTNVEFQEEVKAMALARALRFLNELLLIVYLYLESSNH